MSLKERLDKDLKEAMLSGDKVLTTTLRGIKSVILYAEVEQGSRNNGLKDDMVVSLLQKEAKKRLESAEMYKQGGRQDKADAELIEREVIMNYLPEQMTEDEIISIINKAVADSGGSSKDMGKIIGIVKQQSGAKADGSVIARLVKERLSL